MPTECLNICKGLEVRDFTENNTGVKLGWADRPALPEPYSGNTVY